MYPIRMARGLSENNKTNNTSGDVAVQSIQRAAEILNCVSNGINSLTDIASRCHLSKSTTHRLLKTLKECELIIQDPVNHQYYLGYSFIRLIFTPITTQEYLISCASEEMSTLSEKTGETVSLGIKIGLKNINIFVVNSKHDLKVDWANSRIRPLYEGIDGIVLLSQLDEKQIGNILHNIKIELQNKHGTFNLEKLKSRIRLVRQHGYGIGHSENTLGVSCISAPVTNYALPAVLNLVGPEIRIRPKVKELTLELIASASRISNLLAKRNELNSQI